MVEPSDGVALANYGRLVMELHKDEAKALSCFERAVQASPEDRFCCNIHNWLFYSTLVCVCVFFFFFSAMFLEHMQVSSGR